MVRLRPQRAALETIAAAALDASRLVGDLTLLAREGGAG